MWTSDQRGTNMTKGSRKYSWFTCGGRFAWQWCGWSCTTYNINALQFTVFIRKRVVEFRSQTISCGSRKGRSQCTVQAAVRGQWKVDRSKVKDATYCIHTYRQYTYDKSSCRVQWCTYNGHGVLSIDWKWHWGCRYFWTSRISMFCIEAIELIIR